MTLKNLLATGQLHEEQADPREIRRLLQSAATAISDAREGSVSAVTRLDAAYRAIMQCALVALRVNGFRPSTSAPGHHALMIQTLGKSIGLPREQVRTLDAFRKKRNAVDYLGKDVDDASATACVEAAGKLRNALLDWLRTNRPDLIEDDT
jgi:hypothetical protein